MNKRAILPAVFALTMGAAGVAATGVAWAQSGATTNGSTTSPATPTPPTTMSAPSTGTAPSANTDAPVTHGTDAATNNSVNTAPQNNAGAPVSGANSFTEGQARSRIQDRGFSQVTDLKLDTQGVWRGKATKNGQSMDVSMDYQGNVVPQ